MTYIQPSRRFQSAAIRFCQPIVALLIGIGLTVSPYSNSRAQEPVVVSLKKDGNAWSLQRAGQDYRIHGAGGEGSLELLAQCGGNSNRTWGVGDDTQARLDEAQRQGISVAVGIWLEHERHGFDYSDETAKARQLQAVLDAVEKYKNHPAVLVWGIGNEMEGAGGNPAIWQHVEAICQKVKQADPHHPTMTVIAEMGGNKVQDIHQFCPSVDIVGINSYGGAPSVPKRYREAGGTKPYVVTEFGPVGTWEVPKNSLGTIVEPSSSAKADMYLKAQTAFDADRELCLGSYAFLWGNKQEGTPTWFGLLLPDGKKLAAVDVLTQQWTGKPPNNLCPVIEELKLEGSDVVAADEMMQFKLMASDPENKILQTRWILLRDAQQFVTGGDRQEVPPDFSIAIKRSGPTGATIKAPQLGGLYRLYAYVDDGQSAAVANIPFSVRGKDLENPGKKVTLPFVVYDEPTDDQFAASGWMGNTDAISVDPNCKLDPKSGATCIECQYKSTSGWGGVVWQNPVNDWGDQPGGVDLSGATKLTFWVRGTAGGEKVTFGFGLIGRDKTYFDTAKKETEVRLEPEWKQVKLDLTGMDLRRIKSGFYWSAAGGSQPLKFYIDRIAFE